MTDAQILAAWIATDTPSIPHATKDDVIAFARALLATSASSQANLDTSASDKPRAWLVEPNTVLAGTTFVTGSESDANEFGRRNFTVTPLYSAPLDKSAESGKQEAVSDERIKQIARNCGMHIYVPPGDLIDFARAVISASAPLNRPEQVWKDALANPSDKGAEPIYQVWDGKRLAWLDMCPELFAQRSKDSVSRIVYAAPRPAAKKSKE